MDRVVAKDEFVRCPRRRIDLSHVVHAWTNPHNATMCGPACRVSQHIAAFFTEASTHHLGERVQGFGHRFDGENMRITAVL